MVFTLRSSYRKCTVCVLDVVASAELGVEKHLELGKQFLAQGQLNDALHHYDEAISKCCEC